VWRELESACLGSGLNRTTTLVIFSVEVAEHNVQPWLGCPLASILVMGYYATLEMITKGLGAVTPIPTSATDQIPLPNDF